jgi:FkbM family methyltransferase
MMNLDNFKYEESGLNTYLRERDYKKYLELTKRSPAFFSLAGDAMPIPLLTNGVYEPLIKSFIDFCAVSGHSDFLLDIGANIGLSSCQSGKAFKEVHIFEPNNECATILKLNCKRMLDGINYQIHQHGLGAADCISTLNVPIGNLGGAFILDEHNNYSEDVLASKDNFLKINSRNYKQEKIEIKSAVNVFNGLFASFASRGLYSGVIKIDVEGYEKTVIEGLFASKIPSNMKIIVVFENWDASFDIVNWIKPFGFNIKVFKLISTRLYHNSIQRLLKKVSSLFGPKHLYTLKLLSECSNSAGDIVLNISNY